jgi:hypothetical protein
VDIRCSSGGGAPLLLLLLLLHRYDFTTGGFQVAEGPGGQIMGYILGKAEGTGELWHGHVTAVTVSCSCVYSQQWRGA